MIKTLLASTALAVILAASSASAADLAPQPVEPVAPVVTPFDWSGPYVGIHAGYGWGREKDNCSQSESGPCPRQSINPADHFNMNGFVGGAHVGYNFAIQQFVVGAEADFDYANLSGSHTFGSPIVLGTLKMKTDWEGSVRLRAGYAVDNFLFYGTGGVAFANAKLSIDGIGNSNTLVGWTAGGGVEYAFTPNWIGRVEIRYSDFGKKSYSFPSFSGPVKAGFSQTTATVGVSYKF